MSNQKQKLPKQVAQMVEKNNLVMAIKTLAHEQGISMGDAKQQIDEYESELKAKQNKKVQKIAAKQGVGQGIEQPSSSKQSLQSDTKSSSKLNNINAGLDQHLQDIGYKKPLIPYWAKRVLVILIIIIALSLIFWRLIV